MVVKRIKIGLAGVAFGATGVILGVWGWRLLANRREGKHVRRNEKKLRRFRQQSEANI